jgi:hypothetical protein
MSEGRQPPNNPQTAAHAISSETIGIFLQLVRRTCTAIQCWRRRKMMVSKP